MALFLEPGPDDVQTRGLKMARLSPIARFAVKLYFRCQMFKELALPEEGGVLDQSEWLVSMLEVVHNEVTAIRAGQMEAITKPKQQSIEGVDKRKTEDISIGRKYQRRRTW